MSDSNVTFDFTGAEEETIRQLVDAGVLTVEKAELLVGLTRSALAVLLRDGISDLGDREQDAIADAILNKIHEIHRAFRDWKTILVSVSLHGRLIRLVFDPLKLQQPARTIH